MNDPWDRRLYAPVAHPDRDMYRVPVWVSDDEIAIGLGRDIFRYYTRANAPKKLKAALAMVSAFPQDNRPEWAVNPTSAYVPMDNRQRDIGWRLTDDFYILILDEEFLNNCYLRGSGDG